MSTALALYIHWPFCKSKCPYCDFNSHVREKVAFAEWKQALLAELDYMHALLPGRYLQSIFFGGGTPSLMPPDIAQALIVRALELWKHDKDIEITLEANPTSVEAHTFPAFKQAGVNRLSLGVQSLLPDALTFLGREHSADEAMKAIALAREYFSRYSFDLIYARPGQTLTAWEEELGRALALAGDHLSLYQLTIEENTAFHTAYAKGAFVLPEEEVAAEMYELTERMTAAKGLFAYEVSNYAKPGQESRHNLAYWKGYEYAGIGPGAHGRIAMNGARHATANIKSPERWLESVKQKSHGLEVMEKLSPQVQAEERLMMGLRLAEGIHIDDSLLPYIDSKKRQLAIDHGLLANDPDRLIATSKGRIVLTTLTAQVLQSS